MPFSPLRVALVVVLALPALPLVQCTGAATTPPNSLPIGPNGGAVPLTDYAIEITIPPGALTATLNITVSPPIDEPPDGGTFTRAASGYTISACPQDGAVCSPVTFLSPAVISYTQEAVGTGNPNLDPSDFLVVRLLADGGIAPLANQSVNSVAQTIEGTTTELSPDTTFGVVTLGVGDSTSCATVTGPNTTDDAGCGAVDVVPGKCSPYVGAVTQSCSSAGPVISAKCCYPNEAPRCFTQDEKDCAAPCAAIPGSTVQSCTTLQRDDDAGSSSSQSICCLGPTAQVTCAQATPDPQPGSCANAKPCAGGWQGSCVNVSTAQYSQTCCSLDGGAAVGAGGEGGADSGADASLDAAANDAGASDAGSGTDAGTGPIDAGAGNG